MAAAIRGYTKVRNIASKNRRLPMSRRSSTGPVTRPPLNSVPSRPREFRWATTTHSKQLAACQTFCFPSFIPVSPSKRHTIGVLGGCETPFVNVIEHEVGASVCDSINHVGSLRQVRLERFFPSYYHAILPASAGL